MLRPGTRKLKIQIAAPCQSTDFRPPYDPDMRVFDTPASPRFRDDVWDLREVIRSPGTRVKTVNWGAIPAVAWRLAAKELAMVRLRDRTTSRQKRPLKPESLPGLCNAFVELAELCLALGVSSPVQLDAHNGARLLCVVVAGGEGKRYRIALSQPEYLFRLSRFLSAPPPEHPYRGLSARLALNLARNDENLTPRIPEPIWAALLSWAERFVVDFGPEILSELAWRRGIAARKPERCDASAIATRLQAGMDELREQGRGLPYLSPAHQRKVRRADAALARLSLHQIRQQCGISRVGRSTIMVPLLEAVETIGYQDDVARGRRPRSLEALLPGGFAGRNLDDIQRDLLIACSILVAAFSGIRPSELKGLETGCCEARSVPGRAAPRYFLKGYVYKTLENPREAQWVTVELVAKAVWTAEQLWDEPGRLFCHRRERGGRGAEMDAAELNRWREKVNGIAAGEGTPGIPTEHDGKPFRLAYRQFRRTLAFFIGMQPMGWAAGAWQYKHLGLALFSSGYHGTSQSGFDAEVLAWDAVRRAGHFAELRLSVQSGAETLWGPAAEALRNDFEVPNPHFDGDVIAHPDDYFALVRQEDVPLFPGELCDCRYEEAKALCRANKEKAKSSTRAPNWTACNPANCGNAVFYSIHRGPWEAHFSRVQTQMADRDLSRVQRAQLAAQLHEDSKVLKEIIKHERKITKHRRGTAGAGD